jgi:hypothetical protein
MFQKILFRIRLTSVQYWTIDALDEADHPKIIVELMRSISESLPPVRVLLVSQYRPELFEIIKTFGFDRTSRISAFVEHQEMHNELSRN